MLHGWPQHWYLWRDVIPLVAPHGRVIAPDFRGFGWTEVPERGYEKHQLMRDVLAVLDELGIEKVTVAGHDWGGYVGLLLALEHPDRVEGLLVMNVLPPWPGRDPKTVLDAWRLVYQPLLAAPGLGRRAGRAFAERGFRQAGMADAEIEAFMSRLKGGRGRATELLYRSFLRELPALMRGRYTAADLRVPTRVLFGTRDVVLTARAAKDAFGQAEAAELELVADTTHFIVDEKPELVADRLLSLIPRYAAS
jgi:pimeloyl-ACP methyl ester carboxylesterase